MNRDSLKRIDLNLLWVFHAVIRKRKLTLAADQLSMTQSAVSHALNRLRDLFDDELFLRTGHGVEPTARALELAPKVALVIEAALSAVAEHASFDPAHDDVTLRIAMLDYEASVIAPRLIEKVRRIAPRVTLVCAHAWRKSAIGMLQDGEAEIALGSMGAPASDIELLPLLDEEWAVVARKGHPSIKGRIDRDTYLGADHLLVSFIGGTYGAVDRALAKAGRHRRVVAALPGFVPAMLTVANSELIATLPRRLAVVHAKRFGLQVLKAPIPIPMFHVSIAWHRRQANSPSRKWLVGVLSQLYTSN
jgi:DNA-binding transcriptional LysR family regulator